MDKKLTPREIFNKYRSMYAMLHQQNDSYVLVQICGFHRDRIIVAFREEGGAITHFRKEILFDKGYFDGKEATSYDIVNVDQLTFIDIYAKERYEYGYRG